MRKKNIVFNNNIMAYVFILVGCVADIDGRHKGLSIGFNFCGPRYSQIMYAFRSNETEFNVDNVTLDFYCGWFGELPFSHFDMNDETILSYTRK